jgi:hypothetical protein
MTDCSSCGKTDTRSTKHDFLQYESQKKDFEALFPILNNELLTIHFINWDYDAHPTQEHYNYILKYLSLSPSSVEFQQEVERINNLSQSDRLDVYRIASQASGYIKTNVPYFYSKPKLTRTYKPRADDDPDMEKLKKLMISLGIQGCMNGQEIVYANTGNTVTADMPIPSEFGTCPPRQSDDDV